MDQQVDLVLTLAKVYHLGCFLLLKERQGFKQWERRTNVESREPKALDVSPDSALFSSVILSKLLAVSGPQFPHVESERGCAGACLSFHLTQTRTHLHVARRL